jgi:hypothetical protein
VRSVVQLHPGPPSFACGCELGWLAPDVTQDPGIRVLPGNGAVAQLGERELCKLEVIGSIPFSSTSLRVAKADRPVGPSNVSQDDRDQEVRS